MELALPTFLWLRDLGCVYTNHAIPGKQKGMISITSAGLQQLQAGKGIVKLLEHYTCSRFDTPDSLLPKDGDDTSAKRHNWAIVHKLLKEALDYDLSWERRELIIAGDVVETLVLLKQIHDLVKPHRQLEKREKEQHRRLNEDPILLEEEELLSKPVAASPPRRQRSVSPVNIKDDFERPWATHMKEPTPIGPPPPGPRKKRMKPPLPHFHTKNPNSLEL